MKRLWMIVLLVNLLLSACAPVTAPTPAPGATPMSVAVLAPTSTATPTATATPSPTPTDTATPSPTPSPTATATPTPIPTLPPEQAGGLTGVPDPRVTNPELFDLTRRDAPIPQFVNAMRMAGMEVTGKEVLEGLRFEYRRYPARDENGNLVEGKMRDYVLATYITKDSKNISYYLTGFFAEQNNGEWIWRPLTTLQGANWRDISIGIHIDPGDSNKVPNNCKNFAYSNVNSLSIPGAMMNKWIQYGKLFVPEVVSGYYRQNPNAPLRLSVEHLFYHFDDYPRELYDNTIPLSIREGLLEEFMKSRYRQVFDIIALLMDKYPSLTVEANLANEFVLAVESTAWTGWQDYNNFPLYGIFGRNWILEAYITFEEIREEYGLPRERFTLLLTMDLGAEQPSVKSNYFISQRNWIIDEIARRMGISKEEVQLDIGLQFGLGIPYDQYIASYKNRLLSYLDSSSQTLIDHLNQMGKNGNIYITEAVAEDPRIMVGLFKIFFQIENLRRISFWDALNPAAPQNVSIFDKRSCSTNYAYYNLLWHLIK